MSLQRTKHHFALGENSGTREMEANSGDRAAVETNSGIVLGAPGTRGLAIGSTDAARCAALGLAFATRATRAISSGASGVGGGTADHEHETGVCRRRARRARCARRLHRLRAVARGDAARAALVLAEVSQRSVEFRTVDVVGRGIPPWANIAAVDERDSSKLWWLSARQDQRDRMVRDAGTKEFDKEI